MSLVVSTNLICTSPMRLGLLVLKFSPRFQPRLSSSSSIPCYDLGSLCISSTCRILYPGHSFLSAQTNLAILSRTVEVTVDRRDGEGQLEPATEEYEEEEGAEGERDWYLFEKQKSKAGSSVMKFPLLKNKEKKELRSYAHGLGKKLVSQQVGKLGVTPALTKAIVDVLEAKELIKLRVLDNCPATVEETIGQLEEMTGAQAVGNIGNTFILYRPSSHKRVYVDK
eukprot:c16999_g1_i1 orf=354-1028(-)